MKKLIIIAAFALSLSGCLHWWAEGDNQGRRDNQRQERRDDNRDRHDDGQQNDRRAR
jgi:hypothetical protein